MSISRISADDAEWAHGSTTGEVSHAHSVSPGVKLLIVCVTGSNDVADACSVDWHPNGGSREAMTQQVHVESVLGATFGGYIFTLVNPTGGAGDVKVTTNLGASNYGVNVFAHSYDGVDTFTPIVETNSVASTAATEELSISFTAGEDGDLMFGLSSNWNTSADVDGYNGQTGLDPGSLNNNQCFAEAFFKAWGADNDLGTQNSNYGSLLGIVLGEASEVPVCMPCVLINMGEL